MVNLGHVRKVHGHGEVPVYLATMAAVILLGLAEGVLFGLALAALIALRRLTWVTVRTRRHPDGRHHATICGSLTFLGVPRLTQELRAIPPGVAVDLDLNIDFMDNAAFEAIHAWRLDHERLGGTVDIDELHDEWYTMAASGVRMYPAKTPPRAPDRLVAAVGAPPSPPRAPAMAHRRPGARRGRTAITGGAREFHRRTAPLVRPHLHRAGPQAAAPHLFITCADSRVVPT